MSRVISLEVLDRLTGERRIERCGLPVEVGKQPEGEHRVTLAPHYHTVSRRHGRLEDEGGRLIYVDSSSNGSTIGGLLLKGGRRHLAKGDAIQIENYTIRVIEAAPLRIKHTTALLADLGDLTLSPGEVVDIAATPAGLRMMVAPVGQAAGQGDVADSSQTPAARFTIGESGVAVEVLDPALVTTLSVNRARPPGATHQARLKDVVGLGADRFEILQPDMPKIVCGNAACHLLNDLPFEENCTWCGFYLAASGSFTRVTPR